MPGEFVDTHCHLDLAPLSVEVDAVLARALAVGVRQCVTIGTTLDASRANVALAQRYPQLAAAVGVHPNESEAVTDDVVAAIDVVAAQRGVVAIGEIGLDFYRHHAAHDQQERALRAFIAIAQRRRLPLIFHCRDAYEPLLRVLQEEVRSTVRGVIHCASGPAEFIQETLARGLYISFAGNVTFPNAHALRQLVGLVPDDRLLIETDAPFLAPQPVRGQTNEPAHVTHTAACLAQLRSTTVDILGTLTSRNARRLFGLTEPEAIV